MTRPRVLVVPYLRGWTYDFTAQAMKRHLSQRFDFQIAYSEDIQAHHRARAEARHSAIDAWTPDVVVDMWWHGTLHYEFGLRTMKQISSHRWGTSEKFGKCTPEKLLSRYAEGVGAIVVPSHRLRDLLAPLAGDRPVIVAPKGVDPEFVDHGTRNADELAIGWAGASDAKDKRLEILRAAAPNLVIADACGSSIPFEAMPAWYNAIDVIAIASEAEGDPRPLIEGMACGCFPITTDVGIVPELIEHGANGLIVEPTVEAFERAFAWAASNPRYIRRMGADNARALRVRRAWANVMPLWGDAIDATIERSRGVAA
jgi:hypothetical protein